MAKALEDDRSWAREDGTDRPASIGSRLRRSWWDLIGASPGSEGSAADERGGDNPGALIFSIIGALALLVVIAAIRDGSAFLLTALPIVAAALVFEVATQAVERRHPRSFRLMLVKVAFYAVCVGAALYAVIAATGPGGYARHPLAFMIYLLVISISGLRDEPRLPLGAGLLSILSYLGVVLWVPGVAAESDPQKAAALLRDFDGTSVIGHLVILVCTTLMAMATARRGLAVRRLSVRDGLTGLLNRRVFDACLASEADRARRTGQPLSIAMIDVDFFKSLNDTYGHSFGDDVLRWVAVLLRESFRSNDLVARYGGEEFAVLFLDSADDRLVERLDALREKIARTELRPSETGEVVRVSVSVGVASWPEDAEEVEAALAVADQRLYLAKGTGRNRIVASSLDE